MSEADWDGSPPEERRLMEGLARLVDPPVPAGMRDRFEERLRAVPRRRNGVARPSPRRLGLAIAASLVLATAAGVWVTRQHRSAARAPSSAAELLSIEELTARGTADGQALAELRSRAVNDASATVRLASLDALARLGGSSAVVPVLRRLIPVEESPFVQSRVASLLVTLPDDLREELEGLFLARTDLDPFMRNVLSPVVPS